MMDGLASFAHDPILPLHDDGNVSEYGGSVDGNEEQPSRSSLDFNDGDEDANELLEVFGDDYFSERKASVGSQADNNDTEAQNSHSDDIDFGGTIHSTEPDDDDHNNSAPSQTQSYKEQRQRLQQAEQELLSSFQQSLAPQNLQERQFPVGAFSSATTADSSFQTNMATVASMYHSKLPANGQAGIQMNPYQPGSNTNSQQPSQAQHFQSQQQQHFQGHFMSQGGPFTSQNNFQPLQEFQQSSTPSFQQQQQIIPISQSSGGNSFEQQTRLSPPNTGSTHSLAVQHPIGAMQNGHAQNGFQNTSGPFQVPPSASVPQAMRRSEPSNDTIELLDDDGEPPSKKARVETIKAVAISPASASNEARAQNMPSWMTAARGTLPPQAPTRPSELIRPNGSHLTGYRPTSTSYVRPAAPAMKSTQHPPRILIVPADFKPTWETPLPSQSYRRPPGRRRYELSLVNVKEFTITGLPVSWEGPPSSLAGLRKTIKELSKEHGKATYERNQDGSEGRWRIPLGAYSAFYSYLNSDTLVQVIGIPQDQLKIASLGKARLEKGYPSSKKLISLGVPRGLAMALAPFQRGGVDFVVERGGRALIADEMGLGKTVQGIAGMAVFHQDWPILVLTPSSARYHWENEFQHWLGRDSPINKEKQARINLGGESDGEEEEDDGEIDESKCMPLLDDSQVYVLTSGKDPVFPNPNIKVVICSYGLAPALAASGVIYPGLFGAAIVDESHMLKNMNTKRTKSLVPVLHAAKRCVLLSGTPALAKPTELWPQLKILSTEQNGWWEDESEFLEKYVKNSSPVRRAELHAMLTGTVMIRRLKHDILKSLPKKARGRAVVDVSTPDMKREFHKCMSLLREGKGQLGKLARAHSALGPVPGDTPDRPIEAEPSRSQSQFSQAAEAIKREREAKFASRMQEVDFALANAQGALSGDQMEQFRAQWTETVNRELQVWYDERIHELEQELPQPEDEEISRKSVLNRMYSLTGKAKLPLVATMIQKWLSDPTKGKLCVFAHHIFVLDELVRLAGLSNLAGSKTSYIRIDGSTSPKERQAQIKKFQTDPNVRIAILGITAAGVAVTLTASSTVWFAELFWTPALMIQAEDRCHRIGQNARVNCLYFVGIGTLDELLWKLLEKKFRDLGEFVEGQEKQKIVVHKTYHGTKDLDAMFEIPDGGESDEEENPDEDDDAEDTELLKLQPDLEGDIAQLVKEELTMMKADGDDDDGGDDSALQDTKSGEPVAGSTEEEAIMLSDDEVEAPSKSSNGGQEQESEKEGAPESAGNVTTQSAAENPSGTSEKNVKNASKLSQLDGCRGYGIVFEGNSFGMQLFPYKGRAIVGRRLLNKNCEKPAVGDALVAVNGQRLPLTDKINDITNFMKASIDRGPVELIFVEHPTFKQIAERQIERENQIHAERRRLAAQQAELQAKMARPITKGPDDVIDLLDDD